MRSRIVDQAGGVVFRVRGGRPQVLVVSSRRSPGQWIFPKGLIEDGETSKATAIRETQEEAGVDGRALARLRPRIEFEVGDVLVRVQYYLLVATSDVASSEGRAKRWLEPRAALDIVAHDGLKTVLRSAIAELKRTLASEWLAVNPQRLRRESL